MKITKELALTLLKESQAFRSYVADMLFDKLPVLKERIYQTIMLADGKVDAIKKVREISREHSKDFQAIYSNLEWYVYPDRSEVLGLASCKKFVESIRKFD